MKIVVKRSEATFSLTREDETERIDGVGRLKKPGRLLDWSDDDWPEILHNISKARQVWGRLGKILWREGVEPTVLEKFYRALVQAVLMFGAETWVLTEIMSQSIEGAHVGLLRQVTCKNSMRKSEGY